MTFGTKLRKLRLERGYSQAHVADFIGVDQSSYCRLESDKVQPKLQIALKIAQLYHIDLTMLYAATIGIL
ncbi:helix-turn-helix transcriptional regulator [Emticicia agri]|uniref:XRE family transcriptional regulator n=1 Tax=Emticicia agri TaxID=2492393 RepID=A0A4Q5M1R2_9BACT|nr:helix-turn-helix transcriptional regulator [Emticicia agri]RYU95803.1 XRE family transcriptional regulator [Emticicia agri]